MSRLAASHAAHCKVCIPLPPKPHSWTWDEDTFSELAHFKRDRRNEQEGIGDQLVAGGWGGGPAGGWWVGRGASWWLVGGVGGQLVAGGWR